MNVVSKKEEKTGQKNSPIPIYGRGVIRLCVCPIATNLPIATYLCEQTYLPMSTYLPTSTYQHIQTNYHLSTDP